MQRFLTAVFTTASLAILQFVFNPQTPENPVLEISQADLPERDMSEQPAQRLFTGTPYP
ncbi:MAG: hypothetical protein AAGF01_25895 [Cyanobacteria bacterium P01_G01_bin.38]